MLSAAYCRKFCGGFINPNASRNVDTEGHAHEFSDGNGDPTGNWNKGHPCYTVPRNRAELCPWNCGRLNFKTGLLDGEFKVAKHSGYSMGYYHKNQEQKGEQKHS